MKRYLLFGGPDYYPAGGMSDFTEDFENLEDAIIKAKSMNEEWSHIYDQQERKEVWNKYTDQ